MAELLMVFGINRVSQKKVKEDLDSKTPPEHVDPDRLRE